MKLDAQFAREFPELALHWQADEAPSPELVLLNESLAEELGVDPAALRTDAGVRLLAGLEVPEDAVPVAQAYAGHQFGSYSPRLGDGRALLLGEVTDAHGRLRDVHLKGSGPTPFSRGGDGFAVLGPMLREFIVSEAMHALGIPTTRSLAVVQTGRTVYRDDPETGALLVRVASSHLRVGSFQYARATDDTDLVRRLADFAIRRHYPHLATEANPYLALFQTVVDAQASLIARWMLVGFVHGVMNTDNMTISGETIDYGPCAFMDAFNPRALYSSIDHGGRYAYGNQPVVAEWNLARFGETLIPLLSDDHETAVALAQEALGEFAEKYSQYWSAGMREKLGLPETVTNDTLSSLTGDLFPLLAESRVDYTSFFRLLGDAARGNPVGVRVLFELADTFDAWLSSWRELHPSPEKMDRVNPVYIPRNHLVEEALAAADNGEMAPVGELLAAVTSPFEKRPGLERYAQPAPTEFGPYRTYCGT